MRPYRGGQGGDAECGEYKAAVAEDGFAGENGEDLGDDAEERQRDDVDLGVPEEPEQVLPEDRPAVGRVEHVGPEVPVRFQAQQRGGEDRKGDQDEDPRGQDFPGEHGQPPHRHAGAAQADDGGDHVDRAEDGADTGDDQAHRPEVTADLWGVADAREGGVGGPAERGGPAGGGEPGHGDQRAEQVQPVGEGVEPGERDVGGADLQRDDEVGEPEDDGGGVEQQHDRAVHGEQLVVLLRGEELHAGLGQFGPHQQGQHPTGQEEPQGGDDVHDPQGFWGRWFSGSPGTRRRGGCGGRGRAGSGEG